MCKGGVDGSELSVGVFHGWIPGYLITNANVTLEAIGEGRSEDIFAKGSIAVVNGFITRRTPYVVTFLPRVYSELISSITAGNRPGATSDKI